MPSGPPVPLTTRFPFDTFTLPITGDVNATTESVPDTFSADVFHTNPADNDGKLKLPNAPEYAPALNTLKLSPVANALKLELVTFSVPPSVKTPETFTALLV